MENKITMSGLAAMLAIATGRGKELCEDFLKEFFRIVTEELERGENIRIKGFGTFKLVAVESRKSVNVATGEEVEIPGHLKVIFVAAKELAAAVNAPFEVFEAVEVSDGVPTDMLLEPFPDDDDDVLASNGDHSVPDSDFGYVPELDSCENGEASEKTNPEEDASEGMLSEDGISEEMSTEEDALNEDNDINTYGQENPGESIDDVCGEPKNKKGKFGWGFLVGFVAASAVAALLFFLMGPDSGRELKEIPEPDAIAVTEVAVESRVKSDSTVEAIVDSVATASESESSGVESDEVPTQPSDEPMYDTITKTRFLTTMAKEHYGNFNLWPIIYEENKSKLGHPDRIRPGTKVVVPSLKKYGVDPDNADDIKKVKQKGIEIYARFR
ncbi:MAG: HU family DNA-binding protein [Muribaculaceae bacterium]|nr:HU family DNA-binding protein [Muribaculaceae bacterium]